MPSVLLSVMEAEDDGSSSSGSDDIRSACEDKFDELSGPPKRIPTVMNYVGSAVRTYAEKKGTPFSSHRSVDQFASCEGFAHQCFSCGAVNVGAMAW
ncbi:hypothetical protein HPB52_023487 [Rhipicephalus sanguineus]|uniref:Uncharacterized protein n=1 Tax=Rhipicephalus sanguineus TaxID=34632 RepID=A0A9D4YQY9_RHISA|nr:hypothetical protein HPB52_023487 [Rhipicephalus sanguineus]